MTGIMPTKVEPTLEQSQQGVSNDILVSIEGVEELKRYVWIKGSKERSPPHNLRQKPGQFINYQNHKMIVDIEERHHGPSDAMHNPPSHSSFSQKKLVSFVTEIHTTSIDFLTPS